MEANYFTILYWFCHTLTWILHRCTCVPHPEPLFHFPPHLIPRGLPSAPAPSILYHTSNLDWRFISHMIIYMFQCHSPKSSHPRPLPQSPKDCSINLCLFCCLTLQSWIDIPMWECVYTDYASNAFGERFEFDMDESHIFCEVVLTTMILIGVGLEMIELKVVLGVRQDFFSAHCPALSCGVWTQADGAEALSVLLELALLCGVTTAVRNMGNFWSAA